MCRDCVPPSLKLLSSSLDIFLLQFAQLTILLARRTDGMIAGLYYGSGAKDAIEKYISLAQSVNRIVVATMVITITGISGI